LLLTITYYVQFDKNIGTTEIKGLPEESGIPEKRSLPSYPDLKQRARSHSKQRIEKIMDYCQKVLPENRCLRLANEQDEDASQLYFDFYSGFLYCQTEKVIYY
jgi:hypothetical protein